MLLLNPDTVLPEQTLEEALLFMDTHPCVGAAGVKMLTDDGRFLRESKRGYPTLAATFGKLVRLGKTFPRSKGLGGYYCNALMRMPFTGGSIGRCIHVAAPFCIGKIRITG